ncbi:GlxA family transcriptional regulator, partial [Klebsiella pneumoniae]|nr:GlxA family transcriptional regulator [Klebsiella pneumoniae]
PGLFSWGGTGGALVCCLYIFRLRFGSLAANQFAGRLFVSPHRAGGQAQVRAQPVPPPTREARLHGRRESLPQPRAAPHRRASL